MIFYQTSSRSKVIGFTDRCCAQKSTQFNQRYRTQKLMLYQQLYRSKVRAFSKLYRARRFVPLLEKRELVPGQVTKRLGRTHRPVSNPLSPWETTQSRTSLKTAETRTRLKTTVTRTDWQMTLTRTRSEKEMTRTGL